MVRFSKNMMELVKMSNFDPSKERKDLPIKELCSQISKGYIVLPVFQTYIRWTNEKMISLFNYQLLAKSTVAPISINLIDDPENIVQQINFLTRSILNQSELQGKLSVVDGQQRLSTNYKAFIDHPEIENIVLDLKKGHFLELRDNNQIKEHQIPVGKLYNSDYSKYIEYVNSKQYLKDDQIKDLLNSIRKKHEQYYYVVNFASNLSEEEQMNWFEVLNLAGSRVTENMVFLSDLLVRGIDFYKDYSDLFIQKLNNSNLMNLMPKKSAEISIPLATLNAAFLKESKKKRTGNLSPIPSDAHPKAIAKLDKDIIKTMVSSTLNSTDEVLLFIEKNNLSIDRIDIITYLIGLFVNYELSLSILSSKQKQYLIYFVKEASFTNKSNSERRNDYYKLIDNFPKD